MWKNEFISALGSIVSVTRKIQGNDSNRAGTWRQALMQRQWKNTANCLLSNQVKTEYPESDMAHSDLDLATSTINLERAPRSCPYANTLGTFSQGRFIFANNSNLCQTDIAIQLPL